MTRERAYSGAMEIALAPRQYSDEQRVVIFAHVLVQVAAGRAVETILQDDDGMPSSGTFWTWHHRNEEWQRQLASARDLGIEARLAKVHHIIDLGEVVPLDGLSGVALERAMLMRNPKVMKFRADTEIKMAQMLKPKKYGPKLDLTTDGKALNEPPADDAEKAAALLKRVEQRLDPKTRDLLS